MTTLGKTGLILALVLFSLGLRAQDNTRSQQPEATDSIAIGPESKLMIIPFEPKLYRSDLDRTVARKGGYDFQQVRGYFRLGLDNALAIEAGKTMEVVRMHDDSPEINRDLAYIYKSIGYDYAPIPTPELDAEAQKGFKGLVNKVKPKEEPKQEGGTEIKDGQITSTEDEVDRYMKTVIINPNLLETLSEKYGSEYFLFINQLDLLTMPGTQVNQFESDDFQRFAKVHFSLLDLKGKELRGDAVTVIFSSQEADLRTIIKDNFPALAEEIIKSVPQPVLADQ